MYSLGLLSVDAWRRWRGRIPAVLVDVAIVAFVTLLTLVFSSGPPDPGAHRPDALAYGLEIATTLALLARRRWPLAVVLATMGGEILYNLHTRSANGPWLAILVALYTAAIIGDRRRSVLVGAVSLLVIFVNHAFVTGSLWFSQTTAGYAGVGVAVLFLGDAIRSRRALLVETRERVRRAELEREAEAGRRVAEERLRIARELHDVLAHTIAVITVQAGVAADVLAIRPEQARAALHTIREASRDARRELQATLGLLREGGSSAAPKAPAPGLGQLTGLIEMATGAGLRVELQTSGAVRALPAAVDLTAYRIVQEALTNVLRHARATAATVSIRHEPGAVVVEVSDDGCGPTAQPREEPPGHGLQGMAERASAIGGCVETGPAPGGGFRVLARLPHGEAVA